MFCALVIVSAFAVRGTAGFGGAAVAVPLMALALPVQTVVPVVAVLNFSPRSATRDAITKISSGVKSRSVPFTVLRVIAGMYALDRHAGGENGEY